MRELLLLGGGHSHALALRSPLLRSIPDLRITLVSPGTHTPYSGMLPGLIAGHYQFDDAHIDLARLSEWAGARFIDARATALEPAARRVKLDDGSLLDYDVVSIDIGATPQLDDVPGARAHATPVKPVAGLWQRWLDLQQRLQSPPQAGDAREACRIAVVGGGAGSVELVLALAHRLRDRPLCFDLWCAAPTILPDYNIRARRPVLAALRHHGIRVHSNARVASVTAGELQLADGRRATYDELFWCTGAAAAPWIAASGLATDAQGFLAVRATLQSLDDDRVFGCGDIATQVDDPRPKAGVYAVRQAPVLAHNLRALLCGQPLRRFRPQRRFLSLISLGDRQAAAAKGPFSASGRWVWHWKDKIDRSFMARFAKLPAAP